MKLLALVLPVMALLAACVSGGAVGPTVETDPSTLPTTALMPTGLATYAGSMTETETYSNSTSAGDGPYSGKSVVSANFILAANFDAKTVNATASGLGLTDTWTYSALPAGSSTPATNSAVMTASGTLTGAGTISGATFAIPAMAGSTKLTSVVLNGAAQAFDPNITTSTTVPSFTGRFVGVGASNIYATGTHSTTSGTLSSTSVLNVTGAKQ